jgi:hypothetical protein
MQNRFNGLLLLATAAVLFAFGACKKETETVTDPRVEKAAEALKNQQLILSSFNIAQRGAEKAEGLLSTEANDRTDTCGVVSVLPLDPFAFPKIITVDFGAGCVDGDGKTKSGKFVMTVGKLWEPNSEMSIVYDNYVENGIKMEGQFLFQNNSSATAGIFQILAQNIKLTDANNNFFGYNAIQTFTQTTGHPTWWDWSDDVYNVTGSINMLNSNNEYVNWTIQTPLVKANNCTWISQGTGTLDLNGFPIGVDYGNGTCDQIGTVIINGQSYPITL